MAGQRPSIGEHAIRNPGAGDPRRPMARARTIPLPRVPPADHRGVAVDLRRRHVRRRAGPSGDRARQQSRVVVDRDDLLGRGLRRIRLGRRDHRGPDQTAHDHHLHRVRQRDRRRRLSRCWDWSVRCRSGISRWPQRRWAAAAAFFFPAYSAILPRILPAEQLLAANGVEGVVRPVFQRAVGPAVAGIVVGATFPALGATTVAALFAVGLMLLVATRSCDRKPMLQSRITSGHMCCAICATASSSCCAPRGCCGPCCSPA